MLTTKIIYIKKKEKKSVNDKHTNEGKKYAFLFHKQYTFT